MGGYCVLKDIECDSKNGICEECPHCTDEDKKWLAEDNARHNE